MTIADWFIIILIVLAASLATGFSIFWLVASTLSSLKVTNHPLLVAEAFPDRLSYGIPVRKHEGDCGYDLFVSERTEIPAGEFRDVPCGLKMALPPDTWGFVVGRSSAFRKLGLLVIPGIIDNGYRGPIFSGIKNDSKTPVILERGDRVTQLIIVDKIAVQVKKVRADELPESDGRGEGGFGSSGR